MIDPGFGVSIPRLYAYHRVLRQAAAEGRSTITSRALGVMLGETIAPTQIRKDLCALGARGRRGHGYAVKPLCAHLAWVLGLERDWRIAIVGFGYLGHAFATFMTAREKRFRVAAIFDSSPQVIGQTWQGVPVDDVVCARERLRDAACDIGVIAVPAQAAQEVCDLLAGAGVRAILNFAPTTLQMPRDASPMIVRNIDLAGELAVLTHRLTLGTMAEVEEA